MNLYREVLPGSAVFLCAIHAGEDIMVNPMLEIAPKIAIRLLFGTKNRYVNRNYRTI